jgi:hypothetical protein
VRLVNFINPAKEDHLLEVRDEFRSLEVPSKGLKRISAGEYISVSNTEKKQSGRRSRPQKPALKSKRRAM